MPHSDNHIFVGYKALGFVSNHVPIAVGYYKKRHEPYIVTCVGKAFHTYTCPKLGITNISDSLPTSISLLQVDGRFVYAASGKDVYVFIQWKKVLRVLTGHNSAITHLLPFADHLVSIDDQLCLKVWHTLNGDLYTEMNLQHLPSCLIHPSHYTNKILIAYHNGSMHLLNLLKTKVIYEFKGWQTPITALQQSQAVDVVGVGLKDGHIHLHHLRTDHTLLSFRQDWGAVTAISFRTDIQNIMMVGSESGHVGVWHLEDQRLVSQSMDIHEGPVTSLVSITDQSIVLSSSNDNTLKTWVCDTEASKLRLLNTRSGHHQPPNYVRFHDDTTILTAGLDCTFRSFSTVHDSNNRSFGKTRLRNVKKRGGKKGGDDDDDDSNLISHITCFASQTARQSDWDGIVCCHANHSIATTWNFHKGTVGKHQLGGGGGGGGGEGGHKEAVTAANRVARCVDISSCGNFAVVGFSDGVVGKYNLQSGLHRGCYGVGGCGHDGEISGVFVDGLNKSVVTMGWDGWLKFWGFASRKMEGGVEFEGVVLKKGVLCRSNNLLALSRDDFMVLVMDTNSHKVVRKFPQHGNDVTDMTYARAGRWLLTACMDQCIRVFDLPSASLVDVIRTPTPATSLTISSTNELLATTHVDDLGIYLWFNTRLYQRKDICASEALVAEALGAGVVEMPKTRCGEDEDEDDEKKASAVSMPTTPLDDHAQVADMVTLAKKGHLKVNALLHYDLIKERNRPRDGVKKDAKAPFFLPSSLIHQPLFLQGAVEEKEQEEEEEKMPNLMIPVARTRLACMLQLYHDEVGEEEEEGGVLTPVQIKHFEGIESYLLGLSTGLLNTELKLLTSDSSPNSAHHMSIILSFLNYWVRTNRHADLVNAVVLRMSELNPSSLTSQPRDLSFLLRSLQAQMQTLRSRHHSTQALLSFASGTAHFFPSL